MNNEKLNQLYKEASKGVDKLIAAGYTIQEIFTYTPTEENIVAFKNIINGE